MVFISLYIWDYNWLAVLQKKINQRSKHTEKFDDYITYLIIGIILGGRIGYALLYNLAYYLENPIEILMVWNGGMSFHGGFLGVLIAMKIIFK